MRLCLIAIASFALTGCLAPRVITQIETVEVPVRQWVPVPVELTQCGYAPDWPQRPLTGEDADRWILAATAELTRCRERMAEIRALGVP